MNNIIIEISKYLLIILFAIYTYQCFAVFKYKRIENKNRVFVGQNIIMFLIHLMAFIVIYLNNNDTKILYFYIIQVIYLFGVILIYKIAYPKVSRLVVNNMCMLLAISFIIITRIDFDKSIRQFKILLLATVVSLLVPVIISKLKFLKKLTYVYAGVGLCLLAIVMILGRLSYGAKLSFSIAGISVQPSEFVKIIFVFFVAGMLYENTEFKQVVKASLIAAVHVLILVVSKDLGAALIFFFVYLVMLFVATKKPVYLGAGLVCGSVASVIAYYLFAHVRTRVIAWKDPFSVIDNEGYQITQSLFAIGTGGFFGLGLCQGIPTDIPVVLEDFIFAAICEEMGAIFGICLIIVCVSCIIMFLNIAMQIKDQFYKLVALGLGTVYGFQVFLTIGGVTKFIPSTGVTLPLVSYGGSSLLSTMIIFAIIQGLYIMRQDEGEEVVKEDKASVQREKEK